jgi:dTDP-4-amino-4,6-dideoxygalactose transaminase
VHLYGHVVPYDAIEHWRSLGLAVIEDAAQAHLATWKERPVGSTSDATCFSFFPGKNLGAFGDAGAVVTDRDDVAAAVRKARDHGRVEKYVHDELGVSSRLDGLQAAILSVKLTHLAEWTERRRHLAELYAEGMAMLSGVSLVPWDEGAVHHLLVARLGADHRDTVQSGLAARGIATGVHYPVPLSRQPPFAGSGPCPVSERAALEVLSLPMDPLMSDDEVHQVVSAVAAII